MSRGRPQRRMFPAVGFPCGARDACWRAAYFLSFLFLFKIIETLLLIFSSRFLVSCRVKSVLIVKHEQQSNLARAC